MKYYINHCEITQNWTTWEVEANSYEEAVQKLNEAGFRNAKVAEAMNDQAAINCEAIYEDHPAETPEDYPSYTLSEFEEE